MGGATLRERLAALRQPRRAARIAMALWIAWAVVVWNVVFDRVIVVAGRGYLRAAALAVQTGASYARMDEWMRPAVKNGVLMASAAAVLILLIGYWGLRLAAPRDPHARGAPR